MCAIGGCGRRTDAAAELLVHQATDREPVRCEVCGTRLPDGYFPIRHVFEERGRAYGADPEGVRHRRAVREAVEATADLEAVVERASGNDG